MADVDRDAARLLALRKLADPSFRDRLTATAADGTRPILVALPEDSMASVLEQLDAVGGSGNVAIPYLNGIEVLAMVKAEVGTYSNTEPVSRNCTAGVFVQRVRQDPDGVVYGFAHSGHVDAGTAELVAIAG